MNQRRTSKRGGNSLATPKRVILDPQEQFPNHTLHLPRKGLV